MSLLRFRAAGRGRRYGLTKGALESAFRLAYAVPWGRWLGGCFPAVTAVQSARCTLEVLPAGAAPRRLCFLSDLHVGPTTARAALDRAFAQVAALRPDALLLGGDYVFLDATPRRLGELRDRIAALDVPLKLAVMGNHDLWADDRAISLALEEAGVRVLVNEWLRPEGALADVVFVGIDDPWAGEADVGRAIDGLPEGLPRIALCHSPEILPEVLDAPIDLLLCGHTHGGQIAIPRHAPRAYRGRWGRQFIAGEFMLDGFRLFVSRGVGTVGIPLRAYSRPEVVCVDLVAAPVDRREDGAASRPQRSTERASASR